MVAKKKVMRASGDDSIIFKQKMDYPSKPGQITYYPPEATPELKKQVKKDKTGGIIFYFLGVMLALAGLVMALDQSGDMEIYATLIPVCLLIGLIAAFFYLYTNNVALAKLSRTLPLILMVALVLLYIAGIITAIMGFVAAPYHIGDPPVLPDNPTPEQTTEFRDQMDQYDQDVEDFKNDIMDGFGNIIERLLAPAFFFISAGLVVARAGGTLLWTSSRVRHEYVPGTIILEAPAGYAMPASAPMAVQPVSQPVASAPVQDTAPRVSEPCTKCGKSAAYIEEHDSYFCYSCNEYVVFPVGDIADQPAVAESKQPANNCKDCGGELRYIEQYERYYCDSCKTYD